MSVLAVLIWEGLAKWNSPWAKPALVVYGTIGMWYPLDYLMATEKEFRPFSSGIIDIAFLQVSAVLVLLRMLIPPVCRRFAAGLPRNTEKVTIDQGWIATILHAAILCWAVMFVVACVRISDYPDAFQRILSIFWPPAYPSKVSMFGHGGLGSSTSFIWAALGYLQRLVYAMFGVIAIIGRGRLRTVAILMIALSWPYIFFDRMRNVMLSVLMPGVAAFWICTRYSVPVKILASLLMLFALDYWFKVVIVYRGDYGMASFATDTDLRDVKHHGLDMLKELCFINKFIADGTYAPNWGRRYFAEAVNFVPRAIWPGKPTIGLDYAIARGFGNRSELGVGVTVATGLVGQGVVNFGRVLGVFAVAILLSLWIGFLSRLWIQRRSAIRLFLFLIGLGVTFNSGRDITLLVLFPFVFGYVGVRIWEWWQGERGKVPVRGPNYYGPR
ncbi:MAG: hypothetical protein ACK5OB_07140 [Pirellula sp.]